MKSKFNMQLIQVLLGIIVGVLLTLVSVRSLETRNMRRVRYQDWRKLNLILDEVEKNYVDSVDVKAVTDAAVTAALAKLDPHSIYMPPVQLEASETELAGNFDGIGIQFNVPNDTAIVLEVISGGPSEKVGLQPGDRLLKVDSMVIAGVSFPQDSMVRRIQGPAGTKVVITVQRGGETIPFEITRGKIPLHSIDAYFMIEDTTGYIRLSKFSRTTYNEFAIAAAELLQQGMTRLIFDLRDNSGGYLDQALRLSNEFLPRHSGIVYMEGLHRKRENSYADGHGVLQDIGLTVLINENSASSSEIFAGAIQDNDRGVIVGRRSFGKGLVQEPIYFTDGSGVRLTVARFYTPSGRCIQKPYSDDYDYDIIKRYTGGEVFTEDSIKVNREDIHWTAGGRPVYGGGGIVPDIFVPVDTSRVTDYYVRCNRKTTQMRFASAVFDKYRDRLMAIDSYEKMDAFFASVDLGAAFREFAFAKDGIIAAEGEWKNTEPYLMPQLKALVSRYSKLGENAFYKYYLPVDETVSVALRNPSEVELPKDYPTEL